MMERYFSDRDGQPERPTLITITPTVWRGLTATIRKRLSNNSFAAGFPKKCIDDCGPYSTDEQSFWDAVTGEIPDLDEGASILYKPDPPPLHVVMDMIEFCWDYVGQPTRHSYHKYFDHHHLIFDEEAGKLEFQGDINQIFRRNDIAFELTEDGTVQRLLEPEFAQIVHARYRTGDDILDSMIETACQKFMSPDRVIRQESLESLWDAWERIKTINEQDKQEGITELLDRISGTDNPIFRTALEDEATALTTLGNTLRIRHSETSQEPLSCIEHMDYIWRRMFSLLYLVLREITNDAAYGPK
ncbi:MAG: hypothetical protein OXC05_14445 [Halieaceae bacterium]|nr:hypothetical protein [Halieaceae bacterium]